MDRYINFYKEKLGFENFYSILYSKLKSNRNEFVQHPKFLQGINLSDELIFEESIDTKIGDIRIDVPVWFGDLEKSEKRFLILGLEPRDTNSNFNIEKVGDKIFACPFGIERWNFKSSIKGKPQNKYFRVFSDLIDLEGRSVVFSDIVKSFEIINNLDFNNKNDQYARKNFWRKAQIGLPLLIDEVNLISPTHILALGKDSFEFLNENGFNNVYYLRHPSNGGENIGRNFINQFLFE